MVGFDMLPATCSWDEEWPERLRRGVSSVLRSCGFSHAQWVEHGFDVHHIVAAGLAGAGPARRVLTRWSVSVHHVVNAAIVPRAFHRGQGLHKREFLELVNQRLAAADVFAEALKVHGSFPAGRLIIQKSIQKMGTELVLRSGDALAIQLQAVMAERLMRSAPAVTGVGKLRPARVGARIGRVSRNRDLAREERADRGDASVPGPRRSSLRLAPACP